MNMRKLKLLFAALAVMVTSAVWAQTDVTSTYITNADFASMDGWTDVVSGGYRDYGNGLIGTFKVRDDFNAATVDETHLSTEYCIGLECRWNGNYASYTQTTAELPVGYYSLTYDVENVNGSTQKASYDNLFYVEVGDQKFSDESKEWMEAKSSWTTHNISFSVSESTTVKISLGYGTGSNNIGAANTPAIYVSHLKLMKIDPLAFAKNEALATLPATGGDGFFTMSQSAIDDYTQRINDATTESEINNIKDEITSWAAPATSGTWNVKNVTAACYLGTDGESVVLSELPVAITFEKATSGFYIKVGENYINMKGSNNWDMSATATATTEWTFTANDGIYTISGPNGMIGTDATAAGSPCYGDKNAEKNGTWTISEAVSEEQVDIIVAKNALQAAINAHSIPTANIGTGVFQYNSDDVAALSAKIEAAKAVLDNESATKAQIEAQTEILSAIEPLLLNAPADDQLFNLILTYSGWNYDQKAVTYIANGRQDAGLYNIQYTAEANKNLAQAFTFTNVEGNNYKLSQIDADGQVRYICTGTVYGGNASQIRTTTEVSEALVITIIPTATEGVYNIWNTEANQYIGSQDAGFFTVNSHTDFIIAETTKPSISINTTAAGWGTVMLPFSGLEVPAGIKAYTCAAVDGTTLTLEEVSVLTANTPYIIEGAWNETVSNDAQGTALTYKEGLLTGVYADAEVPVGSYVLQKLEGVVGFYKVAEGKQPNVGENHVYLTVENGARAYFLDGEATGIEAVNALLSGSAEIYGVGGARQNGLQKGVNIIKQNGKTIKVMVK